MVKVICTVPNDAIEELKEVKGITIESQVVDFDEDTIVDADEDES